VPQCCVTWRDSVPFSLPAALESVTSVCGSCSPNVESSTIFKVVFGQVRSAVAPSSIIMIWMCALWISKPTGAVATATFSTPQYKKSEGERDVISGLPLCFIVC
jgi:hypothetical protein